MEISDERGHEELSTAQDYWHEQFSAALKENNGTSSDHLKDILNYFVTTLGVAGSDRK